MFLPRSLSVFAAHAQSQIKVLGGSMEGRERAPGKRHFGVNFLSLLLFLLSVLILREVDRTVGGRASKCSTATTPSHGEDEKI